MIHWLIRGMLLLLLLKCTNFIWLLNVSKNSIFIWCEASLSIFNKKIIYIRGNLIINFGNVYKFIVCVLSLKIPAYYCFLPMKILGANESLNVFNNQQYTFVIVALFMKIAVLVYICRSKCSKILRIKMSS